MKNITKYITEYIRPPLLALLVLLTAGNTFGQNGKPLSDKFRNIAKPGSSIEWMRFLDNIKINPQTFFSDLKDAFELSNDDQMRIIKTKKDEIGFTNFRYQQYYKNLPVVYGEYIVHQQPDGYVRNANGRLITGLNIGNTPTVAEKQALDIALNFVHASKYLWQNNDLEKDLKRQLKDDNATYFPKGELVYAPNNFNATFKPSDYRLTWHFKVYTDDPKVVSKNVYVDALTGKVIHNTDLSMNCSTGSGASAYNGNLSVYTQNYNGVYYSHNDCQATDIYVYNCNGGGAVNNLYSDADNSWNSQSAVQAQFGAAQTYSYYLNVHGRTSWDNAAGDMIAYNNAYAGSNNACWGCTGNSAIFYAGSTSAANDDWNTDDIMGHEFTHGVTQSEAGLVYSYESGALNESFSDIFGEMVESWTEGNCDYLVGADRGAIRSFIDPNSYSDSYAGFMPDTYKGSGWYTGSTDNGGVHHNSSVQNHWFYLLAEGGSGTNDNGESYNVTAIDRFKARQIAYRALTEYLTSSSQYIDARKASLEAAYDLYGGCSQEIISVGDAWHAVGVEAQSTVYTLNACGNYPANGTFVQAISATYGGNGCTTTITPSSTQVVFTARDKVVLLPGFKAQSGSNFVAYLEPCSSTRWGAPALLSDAEKGKVTSVISATSAIANKLNEQVADKITVIPNPFSKSFTATINAEKDAKVQVNIYNSFGVKVKEQNGVSLVKGINKLSFDCSNFAAGTYMLEVNFGDSKMTKKIIKAN